MSEHYEKDRTTDYITRNDTSVSVVSVEDAEAFPKDYQFNLSDFALFLSVMKNKRAYQNVLSIILDEDDLELTEVKVEQVVLNKSGKRAIRLDAWAQDRTNRRFNTEMQNDATQDDIRKRSRYYQGLLDSPILKSGKETRYKNLPSTVIIFITQEDIFGEDLAMYTFTEQCEEVEGLHLEDGTTKIFLNMKSYNGRPELISLLQYMKNTSIDNPEILVKDPRITELAEIVEEVKQEEEWEEVQMNIYQMGMERGIEHGRIDAILDLLAEKGELSSKLQKEIKNQRDADTLRSWLHLAAKVETVGEFEKEIVT